ncbi:MAG: hypothetical protein Kapaf2KO_00020 [Candidatus Kapaibacteriales bacterium]
MIDFNNITDSERLTLFLDGELTPAQEAEMLNRIDSSPELQAEMDDMLAIRDTIAVDNSTLVPPAAVTSSVFSSVGYLAPASAGTAVFTGGATALQSLVMPILTAIIISGGTVLFTSIGSDLPFTMSGSNDVSEKIEIDSNLLNQEFGKEIDDNQQNSNSSLSINDNSTDAPDRNNLDNEAANYDNKRESSKEIISSSSYTVSQTQFKDSQTSNESASENESTNLEGLNSISRIITEIFPSSFSLSRFSMSSLRSDNHGLPFQTEEFEGFKPSKDKPNKNTLLVSNLGAAQQLGVSIAYGLSSDIKVGGQISTIRNVSAINPGLGETEYSEVNEFALSGLVQYKPSFAVTKIAHNISTYPSVQAEIGTTLNFSIIGGSLNYNLQYSNLIFSAGYRYNDIINQYGNLELETGLPSGFVIGLGFDF